MGKMSTRKLLVGGNALGSMGEAITDKRFFFARGRFDQPFANRERARDASRAGKDIAGNLPRVMECAPGLERQDAKSHHKIVLRVAQISPTSGIRLGLWLGALKK